LNIINGFRGGVEIVLDLDLFESKVQKQWWKGEWKVPVRLNYQRCL